MNDMNSEDKTVSQVIVGLSSCSMAAGAGDVFSALSEELERNGHKAQLSKTGCVGLCYREVLVDVIDSSGERISYGNITPAMVPRLVEEHFVKGTPVADWIVLRDGQEAPESNFLEKQRRIVLRNCGRINPESFDSYLAQGGYRAIKKVVSETQPDDVIAEIKGSGLRGRGGAGFPTGLKWEFTRAVESGEKYVICNADEGDPGAFMDRSVMEGDPHSVLEGMLIAGYAIGAAEGIIYARAEYPLAVSRLKIAIEQARESGYLGKDILGSGFDFDVRIKQGAGAFVCGEETALIESLEGRRGMPRMRPPYPASAGLWQMPTCINNVETLANLAWIINEGAEKYAAIGTDSSKGTKVFSVTGKVKKSGLVEVPMGTTLRDIVFDICGGMNEGAKFKAIQMGGPTGGCIPESLLDTPVDYESLMGTGAVMGSGGMVVMDEKSCLIDVARFFIDFAQKESCGKCVPCRIGTRRILETLESVSKGRADEEELENLKFLSEDVKATSLCGLGQTAPNPVLSTLRHFRHEYDMHVKEGRCLAGVCADLIKVSITHDLCTGCTICVRYCPVDAISGVRKEVHHIDQEKCTRCRACIDSCPFDAIEVVT